MGLAANRGIRTGQLFLLCGKHACGKCDSCRLRLKGFSQAGVKDPLEYEVT